MYRPLPKQLTIKNSSIEGLGLFATEDISEGTSLGVSHVKNTSGKFENNYIRTPLGGSINHSDDPNCIKYVPDMVVTPDIRVSLPDYMSLKTIKNIYEMVVINMYLKQRQKKINNVKKAA